MDLSKFDISNCLIDLDVLKQKNVYDSSFYDSSVIVTKELMNLPYPDPGSDFHPVVLDHDVLPDIDYCMISYITDLHLDYKVSRKFPDGATKPQMKKYLDDLVLRMGALTNDYRNEPFLLIGGDVSYNRELYNLFYESLSKRYGSYNIITVLGNHELWSGETYDSTVRDFCSFFKKENMVLLENALLAIKGGDRCIIEGKELMEASIQEIRDYCRDCTLLVLGGIGFSGRNDEFNVRNGVYRNTISDRDEEIMLTKRFDELHSKLTSALNDRNVIVLTHMPVDDWCSTECNPNWYYVNGHTHRNSCQYSKDLKIFADNQMGYSGSSLTLKQFQITNRYDYLADYPDGHHVISKSDYIAFNRGLGIQITYNRSDTVHMLKKNGYYMFVYESPAGWLSILKGGAPKTLKTKDINKCYEKMGRYTEKLVGLLTGYNTKLTKISEFVKMFGGSGKIHGCIVDIDFFNHIYLNPMDGTVAPYYATSMVFKTVYPDLQSLLEEHNTLLLGRYLKYLDSAESKSNALVLRNGLEEKTDYDDTDIYRYSNLMLNYQYAVNKHVIRVWNDALADSVDKDMNLIELMELLNSPEEGNGSRR